MVSAVAPTFQASYTGSFVKTNKVQNVAQHAFENIKKFFNWLFYQPLHKLVGKLIVPAQIMKIDPKSILNGKNALKQVGGVPVNFKTADGYTLDGLYLPSKTEDKSRTMILFNGNGGHYELYPISDQVAPGLCPNMWQKEGWNVLLFNYRGVGKSEGSVTRDGLILDGDAAIQFVRDHYQIPEHKILLHGQSLGGGVAAEAADMHPDVNYVNDRSFSSLEDQVRVMFGNGIIGKLASKLLVALDWQLNAKDKWNKIKGKKLAITHLGDGVIPPGARQAELVAAEFKLSLGSTIMENFYPEHIGQIAHNRGFNKTEAQKYFQVFASI